MQDILDQIRAGLRSNLYYLSLFVALSIPDICGAMDAENGLATGNNYKTWFNKYVAPKYKDFFTGDDCYRFRCSLLHQGTTQHSQSEYTKILFLEPNLTGTTMHNNKIMGTYNIDVQIFCTDLINGVEEWLKIVEETDLYKKNYAKLIKRHPHGLKPYIIGVPVIG